MSETDTPVVETPTADAAVATPVADVAPKAPVADAAPAAEASVADVAPKVPVADAPADAKPVRTARKVREGMVVSHKMNKTVVVAVEEREKHRLYGKVMTHTEKYKVHDENNDAGIGDRVRIMETRPLSATKRWRLLEIVEKAR